VRYKNGNISVPLFNGLKLNLSNIKKYKDKQCIYSDNSHEHVIQREIVLFQDKDTSLIVVSYDSSQIFGCDTFNAER
jgi:hypothetical protein